MTDYLAVLRRLPVTTQAQFVEIDITPGCEQVLALDEQTFYPSRRLVKRNKREVTYALTISDAFYMLDDLEQRSFVEGGYDQPYAWYNVARTNVKRLRTALAAYLTPAVAKAS